MFTLSCLSHKVLLPLWTVIIVFNYRKHRYELAHPDHIRECFKGQSFQSSLQTVVDEGLLLNGWVFYFLANNLAMFVQVFFCDQIFNLGGYLNYNARVCYHYFWCKWLIKDVRANCFCATLLRTKFTSHVMHRAHALSSKVNNNRANGYSYNFAWI